MLNRFCFRSTLVVLALLFARHSMAMPGPGRPVPGDTGALSQDRIFRMAVDYSNQCPTVYQGICTTSWTLDTYDPNTTVYKATQAITLQPGFTTGAGGTLLLEIVSIGSVPPATNLTGTPNNDINWIQATTYDENGNVIGDDKDFFDNTGRQLQTQTKAFYREPSSTTVTHVFATQSIRDAYGRDAVTTLPAPIDYADFSYQSNFVQHDQSGTPYSYHNFDYYYPGGPGYNSTPQAPDQLWAAASGTPRQGSLAWYYSTANTWEPYTPTTSYPFKQETFYYDGTGNAKKQAGAGEPLIMSTGHQGGSYTTPVADELDFYLQVRNKYFAPSLVAVTTSLQNQAIQTVTQDANGSESISIQDRSGKTLLTARAGTDQVITNTVTVGGAANPDMNIYYFRLLGSGGAVTITGGSFTLYNMATEAALSFSSGSTLPGGYYKLVNTGGSGAPALMLSYSNGYSDISYNFYNQLGQLIATVTPEGVRKLYGSGGNGLSAYASASAIPFVSIYTYDPEGRLATSQGPDEGSYTSGKYAAGVHTYYYRKDGSIRFSQSPAQAKMSPIAYSYTNYDALGRVVESGQYQPDNNGVPFTAAALTPILENITPGGGLTTGTKTDVSITHYDFVDASYGAPLTNTYNQDPANLGGAVSVQFKYSTINSSGSTLQSATWYNYDEEGKLTWTIKYISGLGYKTMDYSYDPMGRLTKKVYQAGISPETFVHYYDYDPVTSQLWHVYTNTVDNQQSWKLQATYYYYLHGGLKRIELAGSLQGIDYTYTLQGAVKAINNSNKAQDPGIDGANGIAADAFGEVLDYYSGDYSNARTGIATINGVNTTSITSTTIPDSYVGNIKAMSWYSEKPTSVTGVTDAPNANVFQYDPQYQFTENTYGTNLNFANGTATFTPTSNYKEKIGNGTPAYDENGNIQSLYRTDVSGNALDQFTYLYNANTNQLSSVTKAGAGTYATFGYDANGQMTSEVIGDGSEPSKYIQYNALGKVAAIYSDANYQNLAEQFVYDEQGERIEKLDYTTGNQLSQVTYYVDNVVYIQNGSGGTPVAQEYQISGGGTRIGVYYAPQQIYAYQLADHQGNVRAVIAQSGTTYQVRMYNDYYPFGKTISGGTEDYRYDYQGEHAEKDGETGWNNFELRMYNSRLGRWFQHDPEGQFFSPYVGMGNTPMNGVDKDGGSTDDFFKSKIDGTIFWSNDNDKYRKDANYEDLGTWYWDIYRDQLYKVVGFNGEVDGGVRWLNQSDDYSTDNNKQWLNYIAAHDLRTQGKDHWASGQGDYLVGDPFHGFQWVWHDAIDYPLIDPVTLAGPGLAKLAGGLFAEGGVIEMFTSSVSKKPSVVYTIYTAEKDLYKFGVSGANLKRAYSSLAAAGEGATMTITEEMPKFEAHAMEKYLRSLHYNSSLQWGPGDWHLPGMKYPYPVDFNTGKPIGPP